VDILALQPTTTPALVAACKESPCDLISIDLTVDRHQMPQLKATTLNLAVQRGVYFELCYGGLLARGASLMLI
jgi:ribonuclease P/MRP protein subunit RPP1